MSGAPASEPLLDVRRAGVLLHPTSLPDDGHGVLGASAHDFIEFLVAGGFSVWQVLPLGPPHADGSPYQTRSVHAGDTRLLDRLMAMERGWLPAAVAAIRGDGWIEATRAGFERHADAASRAQFDAFVQTSAAWLEDYALFAAIREDLGGAPWWQWPGGLRDRDPVALRATASRLAAPIATCRFGQFLFDLQWRELRDHANARGVRLFGDIPIFVAWDSADCWASREAFLLDSEGHPQVVAGVPPDYFSSTGQRWGNPLYDWARMRDDGFGWWCDRLATQLRLFDVMRVDHFRGFAAHWEIPAGDATAEHGRWVEGPGAALFDTLLTALGRLPLVAEDLGIITPDVVELRERLGLPGMKVLQFAFGGDAANPYLPHNHQTNMVVYTGTHDNDTTHAWAATLDPAARDHASRYLHAREPELAESVIDAALASVSRWAMLPLQDVLGLGEGHRMNVPGTTQGNWRWRFERSALDAECASRWRARNELYGRC